MTIFFNNIKRIFRKRSNLIVMFVLPIAFIVTIAAVYKNSNTVMDIGIVDNDNSKLTSMLKDQLKEKGTIHVISKAKVNDSIINKEIDMAIVIPKGFSTKILSRNSVDKIQFYSIKGVSNDSSIKYFTNSFVNAAKNISKASNGDADKFYTGITDYEKGDFAAVTKYTDGEREKLSSSSTSIGFLVMSILYLSTMATTLILKDKEEGVYNRIFSSGVKAKSYMLQCFLSFVVVTLIQIVSILLIMKEFLNSDLGPSPVNLFVVLGVFGVASVALGVAICNMSKDLKQANATVALVSTPLAMLGGCFWPKEIMGTTLQNISNFVPTTWVLNAVNKILNGSTLIGVSKEIGIMCIFILVFLIISMTKKMDVA